MTERRLQILAEPWQRVLVLVAHPDDVEYSGLSAAVAKWTSAGKQVAYFIATRGETGMEGGVAYRDCRLRTAEQVAAAAAAAVGVDLVEFADFPDGAIEAGMPLRCCIADALRRHRPQAVLTLDATLLGGGGGVNHADHRIAGVAVLDAVRDAANRWICRRPREEPKPWAGVSLVGCAAVPAPTHAVDVSGYVDAGVAPSWPTTPTSRPWTTGEGRSRRSGPIWRDQGLGWGWPPPSLSNCSRSEPR